MERAKQVISMGCMLGEGCVWDDRKECLYFVDIENCTVYSWKPENKELQSYKADGPIGCIVPAASGGIMAAAGHSLIKLDETMKQEIRRTDLTFPDYLRFNDGKCDQYGNWWLGTMAKDQNHPKSKNGGSLYCIRNGHVLAEYGRYTIPNGMAWTPDGCFFYHIDTPTGKIDVYRTGEGGVIKNRRTAVTTDKKDGSPDGMCMDSQGNLWVAMWGGSKVISFNPVTGEKLCEVKVPEPYVSCVTFGGRDLKTLFITTARTEEGTGGNLYAAELSVAGVLPYRYGGKSI